MKEFFYNYYDPVFRKWNEWDVFLRLENYMNKIGLILATAVPEIDEQKVESWLNKIAPNMAQLLIRILIVIVIWFVGRKIIRMMTRWTNRLLTMRNTSDTVVHLANGIIQIALYTILVSTLAQVLEIPLTSFFALLGTAALAVGLALQEFLKNLAGGVLILVLQPFRLGDYIIEDNNKNEGTVSGISLFYTKLLTVDNRTIVIPNSSLTNNSLINVSAQDKRLLELKIGISYGSDLKKAKQIMEDLLVGLENRVAGEEVKVVVSSLEESSVIIMGRCLVSAEYYWKERWYAIEEIKLLYDQNGIEIPYRKMDVTIHQKR